MSNIIERDFRFTTPVIVEGKRLGDLLIKGTGATYDDDADLIWINYALEEVTWPNENLASLIMWMSKHDLDHIVKEHLKWLFSDIEQSVEHRLAGVDHTDLNQDAA